MKASGVVLLMCWLMFLLNRNNKKDSRERPFPAETVGQKGESERKRKRERNVHVVHNNKRDEAPHLHHSGTLKQSRGNFATFFTKFRSPLPGFIPKATRIARFVDTAAVVGKLTNALPLLLSVYVLVHILLH